MSTRAAPHHNRNGRSPLLGRLRRVSRTRLLGVVVLVLALRSFVPIGFMPATDGSLSLTMCRDGFPPGLLHQGHGHGVAGDDHCGFCTGFSAAPPAQLTATRLLLLAGIAAAVVAVAPPAGIRLVHLPQARAPPALL